jgi:hypothetical protein
VSFAAITLCVASQQVFIIVYFVIDLVRELLDTPSYAFGFFDVQTYVQTEYHTKVFIEYKYMTLG